MRLRMDGFAGLRGSGALTTRSILVTGPVLKLSADMIGSSGSVAVGVAGPAGSSAGLGLADATPITANTTDGTVAFKGGKDFTGLVGKRVALSITLQEAMLYTVSFSSK